MLLRALVLGSVLVEGMDRKLGILGMLGFRLRFWHHTCIFLRGVLQEEYDDEVTDDIVYRAGVEEE